LTASGESGFGPLMNAELLVSFPAPPRYPAGRRLQYPLFG
jgi:hypothetical protein